MASKKTAFVPQKSTSANVTAENLLLVQYRFWMTGHATRKICYWDRAWDILSRALNPEQAKYLFTDLHIFTRLVRDQAARELAWHPQPCRCPCHDESLMLALIRASQHGEEFIEILAASELLGTHRVDDLVQASRSTARCLRSCGFTLGNAQSSAMETMSPRQTLH